jgi:transcriptional regulator with XRE-family HTH domain
MCALLNFFPYKYNTFYEQVHYINKIASCQQSFRPYDFFMKADIEPIRKILSNNIKKYRGILHYSQEKLAEKAGLSSQTLNDIEGCRRWVSSKTISKLAKTLQISEYQLLLPEEESQKPADSSLKSLIALQKSIKDGIDTQFEDAIETGNFK